MYILPSWTMVKLGYTLWLVLTVTANKSDCWIPMSTKRDAKKRKRKHVFGTKNLFLPTALLFPAIRYHHSVAVSKLLFCRHVLHYIKLFQSPLGKVLFSFTIAVKRAKSIIWAAKCDIPSFAIACFMKCKWSWIHYLWPPFATITVKSGTLLYIALLC